ncbi:MAG: hypothetical protein JSW47_04760 [Phycisphaerales bacterium]|nr:MAG: hypothetical protein JSW47_04760 [Phycisphaerales bacterium]
MKIREDRQPEDPVPPVKLGPPELWKDNYAFTARANEIQRGRFNPYFSRGRSDLFPEVLVKRDGNWQKPEIYSSAPAIGVLRHPTGRSRLWAFGNGAEKKRHIRLAAVPGKSVCASRVENEMNRVNEDGQKLVEVTLEPFELAVAEWK